VFRHKALLINVNRSAAERSLYDATRYAWTLDKRKTRQADVVLATYIAATQFAGPETVGGPSFSHFALMSAEVHAINDLLNSGSNPADLVTAPAFLFLEAPTESGMANSQETISQHMAKLQADHPPQKPWWKFW